MILLQGVWFLLGMCLQCTVSKSSFHSGVVFRQRAVTPEISFGLHEANLVRSRNIMKHIFLHSGVMFGKRVVTPEISFCLHEANHVRSRDIMKHIILGKSTAYGEIPDDTFCKGVYLEVYALKLVFCSIYSNGNEFSVKGGLN